MCGDHGASAAAAEKAKQDAYVADELAQQKAIRDQIMGSIKVYLSASGQGFDPQQKAIMEGQFLNQNALNFNQAGQSVIASLRARGAAGGDTPAGGDFVRGIEALQGQRAQSQSQGTLGINLADLQAALSNKFNAASIASGQTAQLGQDIGIAQNASNNALDQYIKAKTTPGFMSQFMTGLGSGLSQAATGFAIGGLTSIIGRHGSAGPNG